MKAEASRLRAAGGALDRDQRFAAAAAATLIATMFLPWYEKSVIVSGSRTFATDTISAFGAVSFVEAAIFLVAAGVLVLVLTRAEGGRYHLPGGDGTVILGAGLWASALIFYRVFDRPDVIGDGGTVGIQWGFFVAFVAAGALAVAGERMRAAGRPEPPLREPRPGRRSAPAPTDWSDDSTEVVPASRTVVVPASQAPTEVVPASEARAGDARPSRDPAGAARRESRRSPEDRPRRDRSVRREDAAGLTLDDPPDAPVGPGDPAGDRR
ncbi:MAG TPA: hypothetical protein VGO80_08415 [Solirubrobacteraceae bacterium]|nr:hypothetical protein [Solirubrobacteraceae bacterium]